jgi:hypothetical protein
VRDTIHQHKTAATLSLLIKLMYGFAPKTETFVTLSLLIKFMYSFEPKTETFVTTTNKFTYSDSAPAC